MDAPETNHNTSAPARSSGTSAGRAGREILDIIKVLVVALLIVLPIRYYVAQPFLVRGASMVPIFEDKDYLIVDEISYRFREPERGESIVFHYPKDPSQFFIKRIIGLPGERVIITNSHVVIENSKHPQGFVLDEPYLDPANRVTEPPMEVLLGTGDFFVLGDNRAYSADSRIWGPLPRDLIVGRTLLRAWPLGRVGAVTGFPKP